MTSIYGYKKVVDAYTTHRFNEPRDSDGNSLATELCEIDGVTYVAVQDGIDLPPQPQEITVEPVTLTDDLVALIKQASPAVRLINQRVVQKIRKQYSTDEEIKMLRLSPSPESETYNDYVEACRAWGRAEKAKLGL